MINLPPLYADRGFYPLACLGAAVSVALTLLAASPLRAQDAEVPRTRTLPGTTSPAFPYAQPEDVGLSSEKLDRLGEEITEWVANGDLVGAELLIVKDGRAVFHEAYGWSDREARKPVERNSIWSIKSMSKPFTATAILMLEEEGRLSLDEPVSRYIPRFAGDERTTIRHLLSHTSGFLDKNAGEAFDHESLSEWIETWAARGPTGTFGLYEYSDFGFAAAGYIVEEVTGIPIDTFTVERIISPLGLDDTRTFFSEDPEWRARLNPWYRRNAETGRYDLQFGPDRWWPFYPAAWGMFSTAMDYARFMAGWLDKGRWGDTRLLSEETIEESLQSHGFGHFESYGYGWVVNERPKGNGMPSSFGHQGGDGTMALAFPAADAVVIFLAHSRGGAHLYALIETLGMLEVFDHPGSSFVWADDRVPTAAGSIPAEQAPYVGSYLGRLHIFDTDNWAARVWEEDGRLHLWSGYPGERAGFWRWHLVPLGDHRFAPGRYDGNKLEAVQPSWSVRFSVEDDRATAIQVVSGSDTLFSAHRFDLERIGEDLETERNRVSVARIVYETLKAEGTEAARALHRILLTSPPDSVHFGENLLNTLGYRLLREGRVEEAIAVFEMNVEAYPEVANPYDSLGDGYRAAGRLEDARRNYERAVELAEEQEGHENLGTYRGKLERVTQQFEEQDGNQ